MSYSLKDPRSISYNSIKKKLQLIRFSGIRESKFDKEGKILILNKDVETQTSFRIYNQQQLLFHGCIISLFSASYSQYRRKTFPFVNKTLCPYKPPDLSHKLCQFSYTNKTQFLSYQFEVYSAVFYYIFSTSLQFSYIILGKRSTRT